MLWAVVEGCLPLVHGRQPRQDSDQVSIFIEAWLQSMTGANITAGFRVTGVYPVNCDAFSVPALECKNLTKQSDLSFIVQHPSVNNRWKGQVVIELTNPLCLCILLVYALY